MPKMEIHGDVVVTEHDEDGNVSVVKAFTKEHFNELYAEYPIDDARCRLLAICDPNIKNPTPQDYRYSCVSQGCPGRCVVQTIEIHGAWPYSQAHYCKCM